MNLYKTVIALKSGLHSFSTACKKGAPIWFINLDKSSGGIVRTHAQYCGEFSVTYLWINGLITNYLSVLHTYLKLKNMAYRSYSVGRRKVYDIYKNWHFTRFTWPRATFISSVAHSYGPAKESLRLKIPCLGVVDTDTYSHVVSIAMPGNDESFDCLFFYNDLAAQHILGKKFFYVMLWYFHIRKKRRMFYNFKSWLNRKIRKHYKFKEAKSRSIKRQIIKSINYRYKTLRNFSKGMTVFFKHNNSTYRARAEYSKMYEQNDFISSGIEKKKSIWFI